MAALTAREAFAGKPRANYCSHPTLDVEILPREYVGSVEDCESPEVVYIAEGWVTPREGENPVYRRGGFVHVEAGQHNHEALPKPMCRYCNGTECLTFTHEAWYDKTECSRCGGISGFAIGD